MGSERITTSSSLPVTTLSYDSAASNPVIYSYDERGRHYTGTVSSIEGLYAVVQCVGSWNGKPYRIRLWLGRAKPEVKQRLKVGFGVSFSILKTGTKRIVHRLTSLHVTREPSS